MNARRLLLLVGWLLLPLGGCSTVTVVIQPRDVSEPVPVFLLDNGRHASLVLPLPDGRMVRYAYGDWNYYALANTGAFDGISAVLWPTQGTLGRKLLPGPPTEENVRRQVLVPIEHLYRLSLDRRRVDTLRRRLEAIYNANIATHVYNPAYDLHFVHHPQAYHAFHNSNQVVGEWLQAMGGGISGNARFSEWRVQREGP